MTTDRTTSIRRATSESDIELSLNLDGTGQVEIDTGVRFFDHMLTAFGVHGSFDLSVKATGDVDIDAHHTVEDTAIVLGQAIAQALGDKAGIRRFGDAFVFTPGTPGGSRNGSATPAPSSSARTHRCRWATTAPVPTTSCRPRAVPGTVRVSTPPRS